MRVRFRNGWSAILSAIVTAMVGCRGPNAIETKSVATKETAEATPVAEFEAFVAAGEMPYYTGKILPTPRQANYLDRYVAAAKVGVILGEGIAWDGPLTAALKGRIEGAGGRVSRIAAAEGDQDLFVALGECPGVPGNAGLVPPDKPQGYLIQPDESGTRPVLRLKGADTQGLTWAVASLVQLIDNSVSPPRIRLAEIRDYPEIQRRGYLCGFWRNADNSLPNVWLTIVCKMNQVVFHSLLRPPADPRLREDWRLPRPPRVAADARRVGAVFNPLGIQWYAGARLVFRDPKRQIHLSDPNDLDRAIALATLPAANGGGFYAGFDDKRFPLPPEDLAAFGGLARNADPDFINKLYRTVKAKYPDFKALFCPPFYFGPASKAKYPEPREDYLRALGETLDKDIGIFWTGPRVKSSVVTPADTAWFSGLVKRKPTYFQNACGMPHTFHAHYITDPVAAWKEWYYADFFNQLDTYMFNGGMPDGAAVVLTLADFLWNPSAYDPARSAEEAAKKLAGPAAYPYLVKLNRLLSEFDPYGANPNFAASKDKERLQATEKELDAVYDELLKVNPDVVRWTAAGVYVNRVKTFCRKLNDMPGKEAAERAIALLKERAVQEAGYVPGQDQFFPAYEFLGGHPATSYGADSERRLATWITGEKSGRSFMRIRFPVDPYPPSNNYELVVCGRDDESDKKCRIRITLNGHKVFSGENPFLKGAWSCRAFALPIADLDHQNELRIQNLEPTSYQVGPPYFMVSYGVVREKK